MITYQTYLLPLDASPLSVDHRSQCPDIGETLEYGTDADCRLALAWLHSELGLDTVDELRDKLAEAEETIERLEVELQTAQDEITMLANGD